MTRYRPPVVEEVRTVEVRGASTASRPAPTARETGGHRDKLMMLAATAARMGVGLVTFIVLARFLGPAPFGIIATAIAFAGFLGIATDYGLATWALRRAAARTEDAGAVVGDALALKAVLTLASALIGGAAMIAFVDADRWLVFVCAFAGTQAYAFADLAMIVARAHRRFDVEAKLVVATSVMMLALVGGAAAVTRSLEVAAIAFLVSRLAYLAIVLWRLRRVFAAPGLPGRGGTPLVATLRASSGYALDSILTTLSGQIDVLLFGALLSAHAIGIYQAGGRLVQVIVPFAIVFSTVYLPALSAAHAQAREADFRARAGRMILEFSGLAIVGGLGFAIAGPLATRLLYGHQYDQLQALWGGFGAFVLLRFTAAGYGVLMVALGRVRERIVSQLVAIALFAGATAWLLPRHGLGITSWLLALSAVPAFLIYGTLLATMPGMHRNVRWTMVAVSAVLAAVTGWMVKG